jgi:hypothetical protein
VVLDCNGASHVLFCHVLLFNLIPVLLGYRCLRLWRCTLHFTHSLAARPPHCLPPSLHLRRLIPDAAGRAELQTQLQDVVLALRELLYLIKQMPDSMKEQGVAGAVGAATAAAAAAGAAAEGAAGDAAAGEDEFLP